MLSLIFGGKSKKMAVICHQHHPLLECMRMRNNACASPDDHDDDPPDDDDDHDHDDHAHGHDDHETHAKQCLCQS